MSPLLLQRHGCRSNMVENARGVNTIPRVSLHHGSKCSTAIEIRAFLNSSMMENLSERIREEIRTRKLSLRQIHIATGLQRVTVRNFLDGKDVYSSTLDKLANYLEMSVSFPAAVPTPKKR